MRRLLRLLGWFALLAAVAAIALLVPPLWVETRCRPQGSASTQGALVAPEFRRSEARTLLTYPEWHIVHAYEDYAGVIAQDDPHDYRYLSAIGGYWSTLCALSRASGPLGGIDRETKQLVHLIGVSFTAEMAAKAAYEETLGRLFAWLRGPVHSPLDRVSARQAADYAAFLQQVPWYRWDFRGAIAELAANRTSGLRDRERRIALGGEYAAKAAYARLIGKAVAAVGPDELRLRMVLRGLEPQTLASLEGVTVIGPRGDGIEIETPRYRELTRLLDRMARLGADFVEIAGNDDILYTALSPGPDMPGALMSLPRQGFGDTRHLVLVKVPDLASDLRALAQGPARLEHVHDY